MGAVDESCGVFVSASAPSGGTGDEDEPVQLPPDGGRQRGGQARVRLRRRAVRRGRDDLGPRPGLRRVCRLHDGDGLELVAGRAT